MSSVLELQQEMNNLASLIFQGYEEAGIIEDAQPYIEAAIQKKGYYEEADILGRVFGYYNGVRVPRRGSLEEKVAQAKKTGERTIARFKAGMRDKEATKPGASVPKDLQEGEKSFDPKLASEKDKASVAYKSGAATSAVAMSFVEHPMVKQANETLKKAAESMTLSKEQEARVAKTYTEVSSRLSQSLTDTFRKIDPQASVQFQRSFAVASKSIKEKGVKEGIREIQSYLESSAMISIPKSADNPNSHSKVRGVIAGVGAAIGGAVAIAGLVASSGYAAGQKLGTMAGEQARSVAEKVSQTQTYQKAKARFDQTKESLQKAGGKAYNAINMLPTTAVDTIKGINEFRQQAMKDFDDKKLESSLNMMAGATGMIGGMVGFLMGMGMPKEERGKYNEAVVAPLLSRLKDSQVHFQKQREDAYKITDPAKRKAALQAISEDMAKSSQSLFSDLEETTKNFRKNESPSNGEKSGQANKSPLDTYTRPSQQFGGAAPTGTKGDVIPSPTRA